MKKAILFLLQISFYAVGSLFASNTIAQAQVITDGTVDTQVTQNDNVAEITGGETRGNNLFHSFQDFSVSTGNEAFFNNANDISNIFSRVTGVNISNIDGAIRANGSANLFLINPAGIIFGENARLDIGGSFYGSTSSSILFEDGEFGVVDPENSFLLTINAPIGLGFRDDPGDISVNGSLLEVAQGETFSLLGGNISIAGLENGSIFAIDGRVELGGLTSTGEIAIAPSSTTDFAISSFPEGVARGNVVLTNFAFVSTAGSNGGEVEINANNITLESGEFGSSEISAGIVESGVEGAQAGDIKLNATDTIDISGGSFVGNQVLGEGVGNSGSIEINTNVLNLDEGNIAANLSGAGSTGKIAIDAGDRILLTNRSSINSDVLDTGIGNTGGIEIRAGAIQTTDISLISARNGGNGNAGDITFNTTDFVLGNRSEIRTDVVEFGLGDAADININANTVNVTEQTAIISSTAGEGNAGNINLVSESIFFDDSGELRSETLTTAVGNGGDILVNSQNLTLNGGSFFITATSSAGNSGNVDINSADISLNEGAAITTFSSASSQGRAGKINIVAETLSVTNELGGASILSTTTGDGDAGNINIQASKSIELKNSAIQSTVVNEETIDVVDGQGFLRRVLGNGNGGDINISTGTLSLIDGGQITADTEAIGNAGNISIDATDDIFITGISESLGDNRSGIASSVFGDFASGNGGKIEIKTSTLNIDTEGFIDTITTGDGNAGNIIVEAENINLNNAIISAANAPLEPSEESFNGGNINLQVEENIILRNNSQISAFAGDNANSGDINIDADFVIAFPNQNNDILANAERGEGGNINIDSRAVFGLTERSSTPANSSNDIDASSEFSFDGNVTINSLDNFVLGAIELPTDLITSDQTSAQACQANRESAAKNGLNIAGKGGVPPAPELPLDSQNITVNGNSNSTSVIHPPLKTSQRKIQPARGVSIAESGEVVLTAYRTSNSGERILDGSLNCN